MYDVLVLDYLAQLQPARPKTREVVQNLYEYPTGLVSPLLLLQNQPVQVQVYIA